ncbi:hypothetical protein IT398_02435 [Candidatus Nomurabacteria bacterium]|nr:hypothetical protein [Candidatus Nomurabacteria bacterium]
MVWQTEKEQIFEAKILGELGTEVFDATAIFHLPRNTFIIVVDETTDNSGFVGKLENLLTKHQLETVRLNTSKKVCFVPRKSQTCQSLLRSIRSAGVKIVSARVGTWT